MKETNVYRVMFKNGTERTLTRVEEDGKRAIGLWIWCLKQCAPKVINFTECAILASEIVSIDEPEPFEDLMLSTKVEPYDKEEPFRPEVSG